MEITALVFRIVFQMILTHIIVLVTANYMSLPINIGVYFLASIVTALSIAYSIAPAFLMVRE